MADCVRMTVGALARAEGVPSAGCGCTWVSTSSTSGRDLDRLDRRRDATGPAVGSRQARPAVRGLDRLGRRWPRITVRDAKPALTP